MWFVVKGSVIKTSVTNVVCCEWSIMNRSVLIERTPSSLLPA